jgi:hypothetical protein
MVGTSFAFPKMQDASSESWVKESYARPLLRSRCDQGTARIEEFKRARLSSGVKAATLNKDLRFPAQILKQAEQERYIARNPFQSAKFFSNEGRERRKQYILSWEEQQKLLAVAPPRIRVFTVLGVGVPNTKRSRLPVGPVKQNGQFLPKHSPLWSLP